MRTRFSMQGSYQKRLSEYKDSTEFRVRRIWEQQYNQPSLNNPLFEDVPLEVHVAHLSAVMSSSEERVDSDEPDERMLEIMRIANEGGDPFEAVRDKLTPNEDFKSITF